MKKKSLLTLLSALVALCACTACEELNVAPPENTELIPDRYYSQTEEENDSFMTIDGKLDEEIYQTATWLEFSYASNIDGTLPKVKLTGFTSELGVYIASFAQDSNVRYGADYMDQIASAACTSWSLSIAVDKKGEEPARDRNNWFTYYIDCKGNVICMKNSRRAAYIDGEVNGGQTVGVSFEVFLPWSQFDFTEEERPSEFGIMPYYNGCFPEATKTTKFELQPSYGNDRTENYFRFGALEDGRVGYTSPEVENALFGNACSGYPRTAMWDLSEQAEGKVECIGGGYNVVYFTDSYAENFVVSTTMYPVCGINDPYPKAGIYTMTTEGWYYTAMLDMQPSWVVDGANGSKTLLRHRIYTLNNNNPQRWDFKAFGSQVENTDYANDEGVQFTMVKNGARAYYFVDGKYFGAEEIASTFSGKVFVGFYSLAMDVVYDDCSYEELTSEQVLQYLNERQVYSVEVGLGSAGGTVSASSFEVEAGGSVKATILCKSGYELASVLLNGEEVIEDVREYAVDGVYTLKDVDENIKLTFSFKKIENSVKLSGFLRLDGEEEGTTGTVTIRSLEDSSIVYSLTASIARGYTCQLKAGKYEVSSSRKGYNVQRDVIDISEDMTLDVVLAKMPPVAYKTWTMWYSEDTGTLGTTNITDSFHASGVHFATQSETVFFSGNFVIDKWAFQGFSISSGNTYIRFMSRASGFNIWTITKTEGNIIAENTSLNTCLKDERNGVAPETKSPDTVYPISGSGEQKSWTFVLVIENDIMRIYYDGVWCYEIDLTKYGFAKGSKYDVGIVKPAYYQTLFTANVYELKAGACAKTAIDLYEER